MTDMWEPKTQKGVFGMITLWVLGLLALGIAISLIGWGVGWFAAPYQGKLEARKQINSGSFRIAAYNHFFDLCAAVQSDEASLDAQRVELASATGDDRARIEANIAGLSADRADAINQYNADAAKSYTVGQFRSSGLPWQLDSTAYHGGGHTVCAR